MVRRKALAQRIRQEINDLEQTIEYATSMPHI